MNCTKCNQHLEGNETVCPGCGTFVAYGAPTPTYNPAYGEVPPEVKKWNWGAFMFNMMWGIGSHTYLPLLCLIPFFNIIWVFVCGAKGNEWAWKSGKFNNLDHFLAAQETWNRAGIFSIIITGSILALYILGIILVLALSSI